MKTLLRLLFFFLTAQSLHGAHIYFQQVKKIDPPAQLVAIAKELRDSFNTNVYVFEDEYRFLISLDGYSHIYQVDSGFQVNNLYKGRYHRYNIGAYKWYYDNFIYAYGGNLLWNFFPEIVFFKEDVGGWEIQNYLGDKPIPIDTTSYLVYFFNNKLFVIILQPTLYVQGKTIFEYNFPELTWKMKAKIKENIIPEKFTQVDLKNFVFLIEPDGKCIILNKEKFTVFTLDSSLPFKDMIFFASKDELIVKDKDNRNTLLNFKSPTIFENQDNSEPILRFSFPWETLLLILAIPLFFIFKRKRTDPNIFPYPDLIQYKGQIIDQEKLDECLGVNFYSSISSKRNKRSKTIIFINQKYRSTISIERVRDDLDSRMFKYKIW